MRSCSCLWFMGKWAFGRFGDSLKILNLVVSRVRIQSGSFSSKTSFNDTTKHLHSCQNLKINHLDENISKLDYTVTIFTYKIQLRFSVNQGHYCKDQWCQLYNTVSMNADSTDCSAMMGTWQLLCIGVCGFTLYSYSLLPSVPLLQLSAPSSTF